MTTLANTKCRHINRNALPAAVGMSVATIDATAIGATVIGMVISE
jgi:hypothetical protein